MKKRLLLAMLIVLSVFLSVSAVCASEVNVTDSYAASLVDDTSDVSLANNVASSSDISVSSDSNVDNDSSKVSLSSEEVLESDNSNILSTNTNVNKDNTINSFYSDDAVLGANSKDDTKLTWKSSSSLTNGDQSVKVLLTSNNKPVSGKIIHLKAQSRNYSATTDSNGIATFNIVLNSVGSSYVTYAFDEDNKYKASSGRTTISVTGKTKVTWKSATSLTNGDQSVKVLLTSNDKPVSGKVIHLKAQSKTYTATTDSNGIATFKVALNSVGSSYVTYAFDAEQWYRASSGKTTISVTGNTKVTWKSATSYANGVKTVKVLLTSNDKPVSGKVIHLKAQSVSYTATTDSSGIATFKITLNSVGSSYVTYSFDGEQWYKASSGKTTISVTGNTKVTWKSATSFSNGDQTVKVLLTSNDKPVSGKVIHLKAQSKTYTATTDSNGIATFKVALNSVGSSYVTYSFDAEQWYKASSGKTTISVTGNTKVTWKSATAFLDGVKTVKVLLTSNDKPVSGKVIHLKAQSVSYTATTDSSGIATFKITLNSPGTSYVTYSFDGEQWYKPSSGKTTITVSKKQSLTNSYGYFVFAADMNNVNLKTLASTGVTDLFLNYYAFEKYGQSAVETWIANANKLDLRVHIWMQAFYDGGKWVNPIVNGAYNKDFANKKIAEAKSYANVKGVSGICFDYLRYPGNAYNTKGGTDAISQFTKSVISAIRAIDPSIIISATLMPETTQSAYYYGQDYSVISKYMDVVLPMVYKGNYGKNTAWIKSTTKWYADNSQGAKVWSTLQSYVSDSDTTKLDKSVLENDALNALYGGAKGVILFRYGLSNLISFEDVDSQYNSGGPASVSISDILTGSNNLKNYYANNNVMPKTVTVAGHAYTLSEFLYLMSQAISQLGSSDSSAVKCIYDVKAASSPSGGAINAQLLKSDYITVAKNVADYIKSNKQAPNYASSAVGKLSYTTLADAFSRILAFYKNNDNYMPNYVTIKQSSSSPDGPDYEQGGMNVPNTITDLEPYYKATANCEVNDTTIKNLVDSLTAGLTTDKQKALVIYNYVRDQISYSFYYDTQKGAKGTLASKSGNCVDQAHLLVAMYRTAGLAARYEHGTCYFTLSGSTYGHVWTQVLLDNVWVVGDPSSNRNYLGTVISWNTNSYTHHGYYASLPF